MYLIENSLIYKKEQCTPEDAGSTFFLHLDPVDMKNLPSNRKRYGFDNLDFAFGNHRIPIKGEVCAAVRELPDYGSVGVSSLPRPIVQRRRLVRGAAVQQVLAHKLLGTLKDRTTADCDPTCAPPSASRTHVSAPA